MSEELNEVIAVETVETTIPAEAEPEAELTLHPQDNEEEDKKKSEKRKPGSLRSFFNMIINPKNGEVHFSHQVTLIFFLFICLNFVLYFYNAYENLSLAVFEIINSLPVKDAASKQIITMFGSILADSFFASAGKLNVLLWLSLSLTFVFVCDVALIVFFTIRHFKNPLGSDAWSFAVARMFVPSLFFLASFFFSNWFASEIIALVLAFFGCFMLGYNMANALEIHFYYLEIPLCFCFIVAIYALVLFVIGKSVNFNVPKAIEDVIESLKLLYQMYGSIG